jgi:hypothetical protein
MKGKDMSIIKYVNKNTRFRMLKRGDDMVKTELVTIRVPAEMKKYIVDTDEETELVRNALLLYPYILNQTISHGRAAEILGIRKSELIDIYDKMGYSYFDMTIDELDTELETYEQLKKEQRKLDVT